MEKDINQFYYEQELVALIKSGVYPKKQRKLPTHILQMAAMVKPQNKLRRKEKKMKSSKAMQKYYRRA